jgi:hypothetical protein
VFLLNIRYKSTNSFLYNDYISNINGNEDAGSQLSHVIKDIQSLNLSNSLSSANANGYYLNKERLNGLSPSTKNDAKLDTLSKDSGVQSNGDVDSGNRIVSFYLII